MPCRAEMKCGNGRRDSKGSVDGGGVGRLCRGSADGGGWCGYVVV